MKTARFLLCYFLLGSFAAAQQGAVPLSPQITVTGTAVTEVMPDRLLWSLALKNLGPHLDKVADSHADLLSKLLQTLTGLGIDTATVQTSQMEFGENRVYRDQEQVKDGYYASTNISFKLAELGKYKNVWLRLATINELSVINVSYDYSKKIEVRNETRKKPCSPRGRKLP